MKDEFDWKLHGLVGRVWDTWAVTKGVTVCIETTAGNPTLGDGGVGQVRLEEVAQGQG